jgi:MFS family permease
MISIFATALGPILAANTLTLSLHYALPFTNIALLTGYFLLGVGVAGIFFVPSARIYGKRHLFILGTILLTVSSAWAGASSRSYNSLLAARVIQGVGTAPFEALVNAVVGDMYFVHVSSPNYYLSYHKLLVEGSDTQSQAYSFANNTRSVELVWQSQLWQFLAVRNFR